MKTRLSELSAMAQSAGFTTTEMHRAILDGAERLLRDLCNQFPEGSSQQTALTNLGMALGEVQANIKFVEVPNAN